MNVLSLFDGMSCGQIALNRADIVYDKYYASEIDKHAIKVTQHNYPNTKQLGDVTKITTQNAPKIDLLIGGSPCQGFSFAGKQLNFDDPRSALFFEYVRLLRELKPKWFLLENVVMKREYQDVISQHLGVQPIKINSALVSAQNRNRLYWTNIPNVTQPDDKGIYFNNISDESLVEAIRGRYVCRMVGRRCSEGVRKDNDTSIKIRQYLEPRLGGKSNCLTTVAKDNVVCLEPITSRTLASECNYRNLTRTECERLQTVPEGYTSPVSESQAKRMLGNGWTVDIISHILKGIKEQSLSQTT